MILALHGVFLVYLALALAAALRAAVRAPGEVARPWEQWLLVPWLLVLAVVLVADRVQPDGAPWLSRAPLRHLFPLAFLLALVQNGLALRRRGAQLTDIPQVLFNVGVGAAVLVADLSLGGARLDDTSSTLLHDYSLLQLLLGTHQAQTWTLSWHLPLLLPRRRAQTLVGVAANLLPATWSAFGVVVLLAFHSPAAVVQRSFAREPAPAVRPAFRLGVWARPEGTRAPPTPGELRAWVLPADHDGVGLPGDDARPLALALVAPAGWGWERPAPEQAEAAFVAGAARLAAALQPAWLFPFPEPDGEATLVFGSDDGPEVWARRYAAARAAVAATSPGTQLGLRLFGHGERSHALFTALQSSVAVAGPRLQPGGAERGGAAFADEVLGAWTQWRAGASDPPRLWIAAAGLSPLAHGEEAQGRFLLGCLERAARQPDVEALLVDGWSDRGHTLGLLRPDGTPRRALQQLVRLVGSQDGLPGR